MAILLVVDHLPRSVSDEDLAVLFRPFGSIRSAHIVRDSHGSSLEFGFVEMDRADEAARAVAGLDRTEVQHQAIRVRPIKDLPTGAA